jgi:hypothetical protein
MAKTPTTAPPEDQQAGLAAAPSAADAAATTEGTDPPVEPPVEPEPEPEPSTAYEQAVAFQPDPWDQLPEDQEVRDLYLALNGHINFFIKRRA